MKLSLAHDLTLDAIKRRLEANRLAYGELDLHGEAKLLVLARGGRIVGPFLTPASDTLLWVADVLADSDALGQFVRGGQWMIGGERVWVAPEIQFNVRDRHNFWGTLAVPPQMDPGDFQLDTHGDGWRLRQIMALPVYNLAHGVKELALERLIHPVANPLANVHDSATLLDGVTYAGYEQVVTLSQMKPDDILCQSWNVVPVWPGGRLIIPCTPAAEVNDYFEPVDDQCLARHDHYLAFHLTGARRFKVGVKAAQTFGRLGYFHRLDSGDAYLLVRNFFNNPSSPYADEPPHAPGAAGDSIHVYNDGGGFGGFGEMECQGQAIGGRTGRFTSTDQQVLWAYAGPADKVARIAWYLLGVNL